MWGILVATLLAGGLTDQERDQLRPECSQTTWELLWEGDPLMYRDMTEDECKTTMKQIDRYAPPFALRCRAKWVCRTEL